MVLTNVQHLDLKENYRDPQYVNNLGTTKSILPILCTVRSHGRISHLKLSGSLKNMDVQ